MIFILILDMEAIPSQESLAEIQNVQLIKPVPFPSLSSLLESYGPAFFDKLIPRSIREGIEEYARLKEKKCKELVDSMNDSMGLAKAALKSLSLPGTLEAFEVPLGLPKSILDRSNEVKKEGGTSSILEMQLTLKALSKNDMDVLLHAQRLILDEEKEDDELRKRFSNNWKRMHSSKLNQNLKNMIAKFQEKMVSAAGSDDVLSKKINDSLHVIESLCSSKEELEALIPSASSNSAMGAKDPNVKLLRQLLDQLQGVEKTFKEIEVELKSFSASDSIGNI